MLPVLSSGEDKVSYGYDSSGKKALDSEFTEYGQTFAADDVIGCYLVSSSIVILHVKHCLVCLVQICVLIKLYTHCTVGA